MPPTTILTVSGLAKTYAADEIFRDVTFQVAERERVALVGVNGAGKSTILRIIAGLEDASAGSIVRAAGLRITYLPQEASFSSDRSVREEARLAFAPALAAAHRMREIEQALSSASDKDLERLLHEYDRLLARFEAADGYDLEHRTEQVLAGLGFDTTQLAEPVNRLSGGQKTRVALAKALLAEPDLLLLDEPTNHLDLTMLEWLESFLLGWGGACLIVSHDRYFLDRVTTRTLELAFGQLEDYPAAYTGYLKLRQERLARRWQAYEEQQAFIARTEEFVRKYRAGQRAREARGRQTRLDRLERIERPREHQELNIRIGPTVRSGRTVLSSTPLQIGYIVPRDDSKERTIILQTPQLTIERGDRVALIGPNGSGKTTLLRTFTGQIKPLKGRFELGTNVKIAYYAQAHEQLPSRGTPLSTILNAEPIGEETARTYLARFLFSGDDVHKEVNALSGGERSRLALAVLLLQHANFLVLDEPTNHLDVSAREHLEEMLAAFDGTILFVSHDRYFIDRIATRLWAIDDGVLRTHLGNYSDYQRQLGRRPEQTKQVDRQQEPVSGDTAAAADRAATDRAGPRDGRALRSLQQVEREIGKLESKLNELSDALTIASIDADVAAVARLGAEYERVHHDLEAAYARWEELTAHLEAMAAPAAPR